jgi:hypothetical protein
VPRPNRKPPAALKKARKEFLRRDLAMGAAAKLERMFAEGSEEFPSVVDRLWEMFNDDGEIVSEKFDKDGNVTSRTTRPRVDIKQKIQIATLYGQFTAIKEQTLAEVGLGKGGPKKVENHTHATQINLTVEEVDQLPEALKAKLTRHILDEASKGQM